MKGNSRATDAGSTATTRLSAGAALGALGRQPWRVALGTAIALALLLSIFWPPRAVSVVPPAPTRYLDDRAGLLAPGFAAAKNQYLEYLSRTARIAHVNIVVLPSAPDGDVEAFSIQATTAWKIGAGGVDNGLALFVFPAQHQLRLEVGYGLESVITDAQASRLLSEVVVPAFARGQYETGLEDFLATLNRMLEASEAAQRRAAQSIELMPFVAKVLRTTPRAGRMIWRRFVAAGTQTRFAMSLFGAIPAGLALYALAGIAAAMPALVMLPWRLYSSPTLRAGTADVREQFSPRNLFARPPPFAVSVYNELQLGTIVNAAYLMAALVVGIAVLLAGAGWFMEGLGKFGGAGATISWPTL